MNETIREALTEEKSARTETARMVVAELVETHGLDWLIEECAVHADENCLPSYEGASFEERQESKRWAAVVDMLTRSAKVVRNLTK